MIKRIFIYVVGIFILAMGVSFSVVSNLGVSPVSSVPYILSVVTKISLGNMMIAFYIFCMVLQIVILRKSYKLINLLQIICTFLFGVFVDFTDYITSWINVGQNYVLQMTMCIIGVLFVAIGLILYLKAGLMSLPCEGVMEAMVIKCNLKMHWAKIIYDCSSVVLTVAISFIFLAGTIVGVREGTVICALGVGIVIKILNKIFDKKLDAFLAKKEK